MSALQLSGPPIVKSREVDDFYVAASKQNLSPPLSSSSSSVETQKIKDAHIESRYFISETPLIPKLLARRIHNNPIISFSLFKTSLMFLPKFSCLQENWVFFLNCCKNATVLKLDATCVSLMDLCGLITTALSHPKIKSFHFKFLYHIDTKYLNKLIPYFKDLEELVLEDALCVDRETLMLLAAHCKHLKSLKIIGNDYLIDDDYKCLAHGLPNLCSILPSGLITNDTPSAFIDTRDLVEIDFGEIEDEIAPCLLKLANRARELKKIRLDFKTPKDDEGFEDYREAFVENGTLNILFTKATNLCSVSMESFSFPPVALHILLNKSPKLTELNIKGTIFNLDVFKVLYTHGKNLEKLEISLSGDFPEKELKELITTFKFKELVLHAPNASLKNRVSNLPYVKNDINITVI